MRHLLYLCIIAALLLAACGPDHDDMLRQLNQLAEANRADSLLTDDTLALRLAYYFDRHGSANERMMAHYLLGRTYADRGELPAALDAYHDAIDYADTTSVDCDYATLSRVHGQMANLYLSQLMPDNMLRHEHLAMQYALTAKDTMIYIYSLGMLAEGYELKNMPDTALKILYQSYNLYKKAGINELASSLCCSIANLLIQKKEFLKASESLCEYELHSGLVDKNGNVEEGKEIYYYVKGLLCTYLHKTADAEHYFRKLLKEALTYDHKIAALEGLQTFYQINFDKDSLLKYDNLSDSLCSAVHNEIEIEKTVQVQALYDYSRNEHIAHQKTQEVSRLMEILTIGVALFVIIILVFIIIYIRNENFRKLQQSKYQAEMEKLAQAQADLQALRAEQSISERLLILKDNEVKELQKNVDHYRSKLKVLNSYATNDRLQSSTIVKRIKQYLKQNPYRVPDYADWKELRVLINDEVPTFYKSLNVEPHILSDFEYDVCMLIKVKISPTNIARLKQCAPSYITQVRKGIYRKLFQVEGRAEDLDAYINQLS